MHPFRVRLVAMTAPSVPLSPQRGRGEGLAVAEAPSKCLIWQELCQKPLATWKDGCSR
jgi:hypothetical protein